MSQLLARLALSNRVAFSKKQPRLCQKNVFLTILSMLFSSFSDLKKWTKLAINLL